MAGKTDRDGASAEKVSRARHDEAPSDVALAAETTNDDVTPDEVDRGDSAVGASGDTESGPAEREGSPDAQLADTQDMKAKFRQALDAKAARHHRSAEGAAPAGVRADGKAVGGQRMFRRKAGGS